MIELYNADCLEKLKEIPDKSIDLCFTYFVYKRNSLYTEI